MIFFIFIMGWENIIQLIARDFRFNPFHSDASKHSEDPDEMPHNG